MDEQSKPSGRLTAHEAALAGCLLAASVVVPIVFHLVGLGQMFLPMHVPVLVAALVLRPRFAIAVGALAPVTSTLLTGMPPAPFAAAMTIELIVLAGVGSIAVHYLRAPVWLAAAGAVLARCAATVVVYGLLGRALHLPDGMTGIAAVVSGAPGIALQLLAALPAAAWIRSRTAMRASMWT